MITSAQNQHLKEILLLNSKHKERVKTGLFTAEGIKLFKEAPRELIDRVFVSASFEKENKSVLNGFTYETVEDKLFQRICDTKTPQGILTVLKQPKYTRGELLGSSSPLIVILEDIQDPGNAGTIIRTAEGAGVTGIILSRGCVDLFAPKTIRSTMGSIFRLPFIYEDDLINALSWLSDNNVHSYGAHLKGICDYSEPDYAAGTAFIIGNEGRGMSDALAASCGTLLKIPMEGRLESLNASVAAAILMYKAHEKRNVRLKNG